VFFFEQILTKMKDKELYTLYSEDSVVDDDPDNPLMDPDRNPDAIRKVAVTPEELHMVTPPSMPHHELLLKVGAIVLLIRNLDVASGLVNGLRLRIMQVSQLMVRAEAITGGANIKGKVVDIARIDFEGDFEATVRMKRTQFPLKLAFAMTINKSQGMTLRKVKISKVYSCCFSDYCSTNRPVSTWIGISATMGNCTSVFQCTQIAYFE
jgi:hypothetical protein